MRLFLQISDVLALSFNISFTEFDMLVKEGKLVKLVVDYHEGGS